MKTQAREKGFKSRCLQKTRLYLKISLQKKGIPVSRNSAALGVDSGNSRILFKLLLCTCSTLFNSSGEICHAWSPCKRDCIQLYRLSNSCGLTLFRGSLHSCHPPFYFFKVYCRILQNPAKVQTRYIIICTQKFTTYVTATIIKAGIFDMRILKREIIETI